MTWEGLSPPYATIVADPPWPYEGVIPVRWERKLETRTFLPYSAMSLEKIRALPVGKLVTSGAHLYLWTTNRYLEDAFGVVRGWGFEPVTTLVWCKEPRGLGPGGRFAITTEFVLFARESTRAGALIRAARLQQGWSQNELDIAVRGRVTRLSKRWEDDDCLPTEDDWAGLQKAMPALAGVPRPEITPSEMAKVDRTWWQWKRGPHSAKPPAFLDLVERVSPAPRVELFARAQRLGWDSWGWGYEGATA